MCWVYTSERRIRVGGVVVPEANLCKLPKEVLEKLAKQKTIKQKKHGVKQKRTKGSEGLESIEAKEADCGCKGSDKPQVE